uniref:Uncharacterized protein n=1 Tax=Octopus bimaculoides TaxID=37653 RepID=A0A0L8I6R7_OCTBM
MVVKASTPDFARNACLRWHPTTHTNANINIRLLGNLLYFLLHTAVISLCVC